MKTAADQAGFTRAGLGLAALAALMLTACAPDEDAEFEDGEPASQTQEDENSDEAEDSEEESGNEASGGEDAGEDAEGGAVQTSEGLIDPEDATHTVEYSIPNSDIDGTITLGLHHLEVKGNTMELLLTFTPEFDQHDAVRLYHLHGNNSSLARPSLADRENLKRYSPLMGPGSQPWATDVVGPRVNSGETLVFWATFAVPEDDIDVINVGIPAAPEFEDVEIDWGDGEPADYDAEEVQDEPDAGDEDGAGDDPAADESAEGGE